MSGRRASAVDGKTGENGVIGDSRREGREGTARPCLSARWQEGIGDGRPGMCRVAKRRTRSQRGMVRRYTDCCAGHRLNYQSYKASKRRTGNRVPARNSLILQQTHAAEPSTTAPRAANDITAPLRATPQRRRHRSALLHAGLRHSPPRVRPVARVVCHTGTVTCAQCLCRAGTDEESIYWAEGEGADACARSRECSLGGCRVAGSRFEVDGEGKLVFLGMAPVVTPTVQPQHRIGTVES